MLQAIAKESKGVRVSIYMGISYNSSSEQLGKKAEIIKKKLRRQHWRTCRYLLT